MNENHYDWTGQVTDFYVLDDDRGTREQIERDVRANWGFAPNRDYVINVHGTEAFVRVFATCGGAQEALEMIVDLIAA